MKVLVIGNGAREHALVWKIAQSPRVSEIFVAPGNAGTGAIAANLKIEPNDVEALRSAAEKLSIDLTIVGPEAPLVEGIVDCFTKKQIPIIGPTKSAAQIESSKVFAKKLLETYKIPCSKGAVFSNCSDAKKYLESHLYPVVVKADGLASGKGVIISNSKEEAIKAVTDIMEVKIFGTAGNKIIIEEYLTGKEVSLIAFTDGQTIIPMTPACDYKRALDDDKGENTGGMGSYSPPGFFDEQLTRQVQETILEPTIKAMAKEGLPYKGILYAGLMLTKEGPKVLEFNARFGDPETQVILPRLNSDLVDIFWAIYNGSLGKTSIEWGNNACVGVVMTSGGYPGKYEVGFPIFGLNKVDSDIIVFHAGTRQGEDSQVFTHGGRVLTVTAIGKTIAMAREKVYKNLPAINFNGCHYRSDIALREVK